MTYKPKHRDWTGLSEPERVARNAAAVRVVTDPWIMMERRPIGLPVTAAMLRANTATFEKLRVGHV